MTRAELIRQLRKLASLRKRVMAELDRARLRDPGDRYRYFMIGAFESILRDIDHDLMDTRVRLTFFAGGWRWPSSIAPPMPVDVQFGGFSPGETPSTTIVFEAEWAES